MMNFVTSQFYIYYGDLNQSQYHLVRDLQIIHDATFSNLTQLKSQLRDVAISHGLKRSIVDKIRVWRG